MESLSHHDVSVMLVSLGVLLAAARALGEIAQWLHQPAVVGEILAGILLGPTVFGAIAPAWQAELFPQAGPVALILDGLTTLAITLFLLVAGMEVDLSIVWRQGGTALRIGIVGMVLPFAIGFGVAWPAAGLLGKPPESDRLLFSLFFATAIAISALPIVVKILMDLKLYRSDFGMIVVAACVLNDLLGWMVFSVILGMATEGGDQLPVGAMLGLTLGFTAFVLTIGRWLIDRVLPWLQAYTHWPGGVLSFAIVVTFFAAAFTEIIGIHAILGSFLVGVAIGDSSHLREQTRTVIDQFVSFIFAPLFFASIGLHVNFASHFDPVIVGIVLATAVTGKLAGCILGARWGGLRPPESTAVGFAMMSVGAMGIIVGLLALKYDLIREPLFVALVVMALATSIVSGPAVQALLGRRRTRTLGSFVSAKSYVHRLRGTTRVEAIHELVGAACAGRAVDPLVAEAVVRKREELMPTGIGNSVAIPHGRHAAVESPIVAVGMSEIGIDFDAPDGEPAHIVFLLLTPLDDAGAQVEIMAEIAREFRERSRVDRALQTRNVTEFLAMLKSDGGRSAEAAPS